MLDLNWAEIAGVSADVRASVMLDLNWAEIAGVSADVRASVIEKTYAVEPVAAKGLAAKELKPNIVSTKVV